MTVLAERLDERLGKWTPETAGEVTHLVEEIIALADTDGLDLLRTRQVEQEVLDLLDEDTAR